MNRDDIVRPVFVPPPGRDCIIWPGFSVQRVTMQRDEGRTRVERSARAGGDYVITDEAVGMLNKPSLPRTATSEINDRVRARLTMDLVEQRRRGVEWPVVDAQSIRLAIARNPLRLDERADRLLGFLAAAAPNVRDSVPLGWSILLGPWKTNNTINNALAMSESVTPDEFKPLLDHLSAKGYVEFVNGKSRRPKVTALGHEHVDNLADRTDSAQAFVALWFVSKSDQTHASVEAAYEKGIKPAVEAAGYRPFRVDQSLSNDRIDDQIIAEIRRSRFLVADMSHGEAGVRGSVYYEAGFAHGLGIPVIFTARDESYLHFDTRQYPHIIWREGEYGDLKTDLENRILAHKELGEGPDFT